MEFDRVTNRYLYPDRYIKMIPYFLNSQGSATMMEIFGLTYKVLCCLFKYRNLVIYQTHCQLIPTGLEKLFFWSFFNMFNVHYFLFSSPELKAQRSFSDRPFSGVYLSVRFYTPAPKERGIYRFTLVCLLCLSVRNKISVAFFSGTSYCSCLKFLHILSLGIHMLGDIFEPIGRQLPVLWWLFIFSLINFLANFRQRILSTYSLQLLEIFRHAICWDSLSYHLDISFLFYDNFVYF
jgi:hypothetical protein